MSDYPLHPARTMPYHNLIEGLREAKEKRLVSERQHGNLRLYCYTQSCTYDRAWDEITMLTRGLIIDTKRECVVATPFPKFFNYGERDQSIPDMPFETLEKLDGSLIIIWHDGDGWHCATKGSFDSEQAKMAQAWLARHDLSCLTQGDTILAEYVAPHNRIVVPYECEELVLLAVYGREGKELSYPFLQIMADKLGWRLAERHAVQSISGLITQASALPATSEGFVLRFDNGLRLKIKGDEYRRIHALISRCTPLAMWEALLADDDMTTIRQQLPEEFWTDYDAITSLLTSSVRELGEKTAAIANSIAHLSDKEVGLSLNQFPEDVRRFIFPYRKYGNLLEGKTRETLFRAVRPTGNILANYTPSYAMNRVQEESF